MSSTLIRLKMNHPTWWYDPAYPPTKQLAKNKRKFLSCLDRGLIPGPFSSESSALPSEPLHIVNWHLIFDTQKVLGTKNVESYKFIILEFVSNVRSPVFFPSLKLFILIFIRFSCAQLTIILPPSLHMNFCFYLVTRPLHIQTTLRNYSTKVAYV